MKTEADNVDVSAKDIRCGLARTFLGMRFELK